MNHEVNGDTMFMHIAMYVIDRQREVKRVYFDKEGMNLFLGNETKQNWSF